MSHVKLKSCLEAFGSGPNGYMTAAIRKRQATHDHFNCTEGYIKKNVAMKCSAANDPSCLCSEIYSVKDASVLVESCRIIYNVYYIILVLDRETAVETTTSVTFNR